VTSTFRNRKTAIDPAPIALTPAFTDGSAADAQWRAFVRRGRFTHAPERLGDVTTMRGEFLRPVAAGCVAGSFESTWKAPGPWAAR
jgi:hypothetical protein